MILMTVLAKKGNIQLVKYDWGLYSVEKCTKSIGMGIFTSDNKVDVVNFFADHIKKVRKGKDDFNLHVYGN